jgi:hypothetical protein
MISGMDGHCDWSLQAARSVAMPLHATTIHMNTEFVINLSYILCSTVSTK